MKSWPTVDVTIAMKGGKAVMPWLIIGIVIGLSGLVNLTLVILSFFQGGTWGARAAYALFGGLALFLSYGMLRFYFQQARKPATTGKGPGGDRG